jgi:hypothetical protein
VTDWHDMMAGKVIFPAADAFGQCLRGMRADGASVPSNNETSGMAWKLACDPTAHSR